MRNPLSALFCSVNNAPVGKNINYPTMASYKRIKKLTALFVLFAIVCVFWCFFSSEQRKESYNHQNGYICSLCHYIFRFYVIYGCNKCLPLILISGKHKEVSISSSFSCDKQLTMRQTRKKTKCKLHRKGARSFELHPKIQFTLKLKVF